MCCFNILLTNIIKILGCTDISLTCYKSPKGSQTTVHVLKVVCMFLGAEKELYDYYDIHNDVSISFQSPDTKTYIFVTLVWCDNQNYENTHDDNRVLA